MEQKRRITQIDTLKGIAIVLVIFGHAITVQPVNLSNVFLLHYIGEVFFSYHMHLFFFVSGYCYSYNGEYKKYIFKKFKRLMIPYYVFNFIDMIPRALLPEYVSVKNSITESIWSILFEGGIYWFLMTIFILFLLYPIVYKLIYKRSIFCIVITVVIIALTSSGIVKIKFLMLSRVIFFLLIFHIGVLLKKNNFCFEYNNKTLQRFRLLIPFFIIIQFTAEYLILEQSFNILQIVPICMSILGVFICLILCEYVFFQTIFTRFGEWTLQIYCLNSMIIFVTRNALPMILHINNPILIYVVNFTCGLFGSYLVTKYILSKYTFFKIIMGIK